MAFEISKRAAAQRAALLVEDGMRVGLGTGSTSEQLIGALASRVRSDNMHVVGVPTSQRIRELAIQAGLTIDPDYPDFAPLDIAIDGADEVDPGGGLIKGGGGALLREKLVAVCAARFVVMVDESKHVSRLGSTRGVPIEVVAFGWSRTVRDLRALGCPEPRLRLAGRSPFLSDHGNYIFDCDFGPISDAAALHASVKGLPGVVETGLFLGMASLIVTGREDGSTEDRGVI